MSAIDPDELLLAYRLGIFPMAESGSASDVLWIRPRERGILPLDHFHVPRRLARTIRADTYQVRVDTNFSAVIRGCAAAGPRRGDTWINAAIVEVFETLHERGIAHSVEVYRGGQLAGGVYGLSLGAVFFAESKFSRQTDASKVALVYLAARLKAGRYKLLDAQFPNPHLAQFGAIVIGEKKFEKLLKDALTGTGDFYGTDTGGAAASSAASTAPPAAGTSSMTGNSGPGPSSDPGSRSGSDSGSSVLQVIAQTS